jgi:LemA protein
MSLYLIVAGLALLALLAWGVAAFNRMVRLRNQVRTAWADVDVQLMRRHDLVPSLVSAVQAYAGHEQAVLSAVTELRAQALTASAPGPLGAIEDALEQGLGRLLALKEAYPDLKADQNFLQLQRDLVEVEEQLQYARRFYNGAVRDLNDAVQRVPDLLVARACRFGEADFFQAEAGGRAAPRVEMDR